MSIERLLKSSILQKVFKRKIQHVGLDLGALSIKLVEVVAEINQLPAVVRYGKTAMPTGALADGVVMQPVAVIAALEKLMDEAGIPAKTTVNLGISGKQVIVRQLRLPQMPLDELEQAVRFEVEKYITMPIEQLFLDFTVLEEVNIDGVPSYNLLVAAAPQKMIYQLCETVQSAGLTPMAIDVEPLALYRVWRQYYHDQQITNQAIINIGHTNSHMVAFKDNAIKFTRIIPTAGSQLTEAIILVAEKEVAAAEETKHSHKVIQLSRYRDEVETANHEESMVNQAISEVVSGLTSEIQRSIDFYQMQAKVRLERLIITGGTVNLEGLDAYMESELGLPVLAGRYGELDPIYSLAGGLATRDFVDI
jgi:type IV pilus assembly protein PilM